MAKQNYASLSESVRALKATLAFCFPGVKFSVATSPDTLKSYTVVSYRGEAKLAEVQMVADDFASERYNPTFDRYDSTNNRIPYDTEGRFSSIGAIRVRKLRV